MAGTDRQTSSPEIGWRTRVNEVDHRTVLLSALALHVAASGLHGITHGLVPVPLAPWQQAFLLVAVVLGPIAGVWLALRGHRLGLPVFTVAMASALAFGLAFHFVVESPDHVHLVPVGSWRLPFQATAVGVAIADALGVVVGAWYWRSERER